MPTHNIKKKKKRSFMQTLKKKARNGCYGKGNQLSEEKYNYYMRIFEVLKNIDDKEEKGDLIKNFFIELLKEEDLKKFVMHQLVSKLLDDTLSLAPTPMVMSVLEVFSRNLRIFCTDVYASHVLQTLLALSFRNIQDSVHPRNTDGEENEDNLVPAPLSEEQKNTFKSFIIKTSKFVFNNLSEFVWNTYASHVIRTILEVCSGVEVSNNIKCSKRAHSHHSIKDDSKRVLSPSPEMLIIVKELTERLTQLPDFADSIFDQSVSAVLQTALQVATSLEDKELCSMLVQHILEHGFMSIDSSEEQGSSVHSLFENQSTTRLMEGVLLAASIEQQRQIFDLYFDNRISGLVEHQIGNFALQKLLSSWKQKSSFIPLYESVSDCLNEALKLRHTGVILSWVQACRRLGAEQSKCKKRLMEVLGCYEPENKQVLLASLLLYLISLGEYEKKKENQELPPISLHGALILQEVMHFNKPIQCVRSVLEMPVTELVKMCCNPRGSHVIDAICMSSFVGEASRVKLLSKLNGHLTTMACSKHGSRSLESLWADIGVKGRTTICRELFDSTNKLKENPFGLIIYHKFKVKFFSKNERSDWEELQVREIKKKQLLNQLVKDADSTVSSIKKEISDDEIHPNTSKKRKSPIPLEENSDDANEDEPRKKKKKKKKNNVKEIM